MDWMRFLRAMGDRPLPAAVVDLDAFRRNVARVADALERARPEVTVRIGTKSLRHLGLLRRALALGGPRFRGLLCFTLEEACFLAEEGFDDLLVAYPSVQPGPLARIADLVAAGRTIRVMADDLAHLAAYARAGRTAGVELPVVLDLDVAYRPLGGRVHLGALRSPVRAVEQLVALAGEVRGLDGLRMAGFLGYEAHVAGLPDVEPGQPWRAPAVRALKALSVPAVAKLRGAAAAALRADGHALDVVNGGGTGSLRSTLADGAITEVTVGSGFLCPHLFDRYRDVDFEPAAYFALEVSRVPERGVVTCLGGGYVASGAPGDDRLPLPVAPPGLRLTPLEGAGEVQTPLRIAVDGPTLAVGDPVLFRHAKAGELAERFHQYLLLEGDDVVAVEPTYRGQGRCFL